MRTFETLNIEERERSLRAIRANIVENVVYGVLDIKLVNPKSQEKLEWILLESARNEQPRLAMLRIFGYKPICEEIERLALVVAAETMYDSTGHRIIEENLQ
jgi:hypothetical protein